MSGPVVFTRILNPETVDSLEESLLDLTSKIKGLLSFKGVEEKAKVLSYYLTILTEPEKPEKFWDYEIVKRLPMPFGIHMGTALEDCPRDYLEWLHETQKEFLQNLHTFLEKDKYED